MSIPAYPTLCEVCKHRRQLGPREFTCEAFPSGIPYEIWRTAEVDHREPVEGDNGIQFEPREGVPAEYLALAYEGYDSPPDREGSG